MSTTDSVTLRPFQAGDIAALHAIAIHPQVFPTIATLPTMTLNEATKLFTPNEYTHRYVAEVNGRVVGSGAVVQHHRVRRAHSGKLNILVDPAFQGQGVGSKLMTALIDLADNWLGLLRLELEVLAHNEAAMGLYKKFGFEVEVESKGVMVGDGKLYDEVLMARLREGAPSAETRPTASRPKRHDVVDITLRPPLPNDVDALWEMYRHHAVARTTNQSPAQERQLAADRLNSHSPYMSRIVAEATLTDGSKEVCGMIVLGRMKNPRVHHIAGLGMSVHQDFWRLGIGSRLRQEATDLADNWLNLKRIFLEVHTDNPAAIHLYEKFGFVKEGVLRLYNYGEGVYSDAIYMGRNRF